MENNIAGINLKVAIMDTDYYALEAINGYLAWDRRTRVTTMAESMRDLLEQIALLPDAELPDVIILDVESFTDAPTLVEAIRRLRAHIANVMIVCLARLADALRVEQAVDAGVKAYLLKSDVKLQIAWAVVFMQDHDLVITAGIERAGERIINKRLREAHTLPKRREYPELTERIRQAIELCVVKGMPAHLAADEMGISLHTIRSYIKEGYRILESYDETIYPKEMSPQEKAFMRITRIEDEKG